MRPRFDLVASCPPDEVLGRLRAALGRPGARCRGGVYAGHAVLYVLPTEERLWSPFLSLDVAWHREGALVRGLFGPRPAVWSLFVAAYAVCLFGGLSALAFGFAQWTLGQPAWALGLVPVAAAGGLTTYAFARYGQHRGRAQMDLLRGFLDAALDTAGGL